MFIIFAILSYIVSTAAISTYQPTSCDDPANGVLAACDNDPILCPGYQICEPVALPLFAIIEEICVYFFTFEYFSRLLTCWAVSPRIAKVLPANWKAENKWDSPQPVYSWYYFMLKYALRVPNLIDFIAIAPYYFNLLQGKGGGGSFARVLRLFRLVRVLRLLKALTFLKNVDVTITLISMTLRNASQVLFVFLFFVLIIILLFACIIFMCEQGTFTVDNDYPQGAWLRNTADKTGVEVSPLTPASTSPSHIPPFRHFILVPTHITLSHLLSRKTISYAAPTSNHPPISSPSTPR